MRVLRKTSMAALVVGVAGSATAQWTDNAPIDQTVVPYTQDSGVVFNTGNQPRVVASMVVTQPGTSWMRLSFSDVRLAGNRDLGNGSYLLVTSMKDGHQHRLDSKSIREWAMTSAYMNGDTLLVDLVAYPGTGPNQLVISDITIGAPATPESICGTLDDRTLSTDPRAGRIMPIGCTGWLFNDANNCFLTAGHCISNGATGVVTQFNVPLSTAGGGTVNPPPEDQYVADSVSIQSNGGQGTGNDYAYYGCFPNSNTGKTAYEAQGDAYTLAPTAPTPQSGDTIRITGYGVTTGSQGTPLTWSQVQKTHVGPYSALNGTTVQYATDTTGGNSGSPVIFEGSTQAVGIHTHGGCTSAGGSNIGTSIGHSGLKTFLANPKGVCIPQGLKFTYPAGRPVLSDPDGGTVFEVVVSDNAGNVPQPNTGVLHYNTGSGWLTTPAQQISTNTYEATIPAADCGTTVLYYLSAMDTVGQSHFDPPTAPGNTYSVLAANGLAQQVFVDENFSAGLPAGWSATGLWHVGSACSPGTPCAGSAPFAYYGSDTTCTYNTGSTNSGSLSMPVTDLTSASGTIELSFCYNAETENNSSYDHVQVRVNGSPVADLDDSPAWTNHTVDLSSFAGQMVTISFHFDSVDNVLNDFSGFQVDAIKLTASAATCDDCYADCDGSGTLDFFDFLCFQNEFAGGNSYADCDGSGALDFFDFLCFQNEFAGGCP